MLGASWPREVTAPVVAAPQLNPVDVFFAIGHELRWQMLQMLAGGAALCARDVAAALQRDFDGVRKHLLVLRDAGAVVAKPATDARFILYSIPEQYRTQPGTVDYGCCVVRFPIRNPPAA